MTLFGRSTGAIAASLFLLLAVGATQSMPSVAAESLNGKQVSLPNDFAGKPAILIVGFSRAGGDQCGPFARRLTKDLPDVKDGKISVYQVAMLESAPRLLRSMILHGMRSGVPADQQSRFLPLFHDEQQWKQFAGFSKAAENDAYLIVVAGDGSVRWSGHGPYSDSLYAELTRHLPPK